jgi:hypothetical protein
MSQIKPCVGLDVHQDSITIVAHTGSKDQIRDVPPVTNEFNASAMRGQHHKMIEHPPATASLQIRYIPCTVSLRLHRVSIFLSEGNRSNCIPYRRQGRLRSGESCMAASLQSASSLSPCRSAYLREMQTVWCRGILPTAPTTPDASLSSMSHALNQSHRVALQNW